MPIYLLIHKTYTGYTYNRIALFICKMMYIVLLFILVFILILCMSLYKRCYSNYVHRSETVKALQTYSFTHPLCTRLRKHRFIRKFKNRTVTRASIIQFFVDRLHISRELEKSISVQDWYKFFYNKSKRWSVEYANELTSMSIQIDQQQKPSVNAQQYVIYFKLQAKSMQALHLWMFMIEEMMFAEEIGNSIQSIFPHSGKFIASKTDLPQAQSSSSLIEQCNAWFVEQLPKVPGVYFSHTRLRKEVDEFYAYFIALLDALH